MSKIQLRYFRSTFVLVLIIHIIFAARSQACTALAFKRHTDGGIVFAKNFDFSMGSVTVVENPAGLARRENGALTWTSKYRTITMNLMWQGQPLPMGGMNEAGLAIETLYSPDTDYPINGDQPIIDNLAWLQYQLDQYSSVKEVQENLNQFTITSKYKRHYFGCDHTRCFALDFRDGNAHFYSDDTLPVWALTNSLYAVSLKHLSDSDDASWQGRAQ